ncbi:MAG: hypothetical protein KGK03_07300 [Candidatus Omnitrophica bacterium]|nr:hypothetical protein [Candidatus Omnitrophota bacterium]MDE2222860.1 hypothetical protein [Candidatus Omnitrophota bacterium]
MFLRSVILLLLLLLPASYAQASLYDLIVGGTIKTLAKVYVKTSNLPKLKAKYIKKISGMREDKFRKYYMKFFVVYQQLPSNLKQTYAFTEKTTRSQVIRMINGVNKRDILTVINKVPTEFIVRQTRYYSHPPQHRVPAHPPEMFLWRHIMQMI